MIPLIEPMLYIDIQSQMPACFCQRCGGERYAPTFACLRCERSAP